MPYPPTLACAALLLTPWTQDPGTPEPGFVATPGVVELLEEQAHIPFELLGRRPIPQVQAMVNGLGPFRFYFDTGASSCVLDSGFVAELGLATEGTVPLGDPTDSQRIQADTVRLEVLELEGIVFEDVPAVAFDRSSLGGDVIRGVLGLPLFHQHLMTLDYARGRIVVSDEALPEEGKGIVAYSGELLPEVPFQVGEREHRIHFDSGSPSGFMLPTSLVDGLPTRGDPRLAGVARTVNSELEIWTVQLDVPLVLAGVEFDAPRVSYNDRLPNAVLGYSVLKDFVLSIDQTNRRARLTAPAEEQGGG